MGMTGKETDKNIKVSKEGEKEQKRLDGGQGNRRNMDRGTIVYKKKKK